MPVAEPAHLYSAMMEKSAKTSVLLCLLLLIATASVYWQITAHAFIYLDDNVYVTENSTVRSGLSMKNIIWAFDITDSRDKTYWHPLTWLSHMLDCQLFGLDPGMHHLTNLVLHMTNSVLLFLMLQMISGALWPSAVVAALFALHPINVDSVAWLAERKNLLSTLFWILTMLTYTKYIRRPSAAKYTLSLLIFILGLLAKPMLVTLPFVLLLMDYWPLARFRFAPGHKTRCRQIREKPRTNHPDRILLLEKLPFFALSAASVILSSVSLKNKGLIITAEKVPIPLRLENAVVSYARYVAKAIWPVDLSVHYPFPTEIPLWQWGGALLFIGGLSLFFFIALKKRPWLVVGWLWFLGTLVPVSGLVQGGVWPAMADRWAYIPFIGLFIQAAWEGNYWFQKINRPKIKAAAAGAFLIILAVMAVAAWKQAGYWTDNLSLFSHALAVNPEDHIAHTSLGLALSKAGRQKEAIDHFREAVRIRPTYLIARNNLATLLASMGRTDESIFQFEQALRTDPDNLKAHYNLGTVLAGKGRLSKAIRHFQQAIRISPTYAQAYYNLAIARAEQGRFIEALGLLTTASQIAPDYRDALEEKEKIASMLEKIDRNAAMAEEALRQNPERTEYHYLLGELYQESGRFNKAVAQYRAAIAKQPENLRLIHSLAVTYARMEDYDSAAVWFKRLLEEYPNHAETQYNLACMYARQNRIDLSLDWLKRAIANGYAKWHRIQTDEDLDNIRKDARFKKIVLGLGGHEKQ